MGNILRKDYSGGWFPSADAVNAPPNVLLRADNVVLDDEGVISLRAGSAKINGSALSDLDVHSLHTAVIGGTRYRMTGAGNHAYSNATDIGVTFTGSGDIAMADGFGQVFMGRSTTNKKWNGTSATNWGIDPPVTAPLVTATDPFQRIIATCDTGESPAFVANEGSITGTFPTGADGTANGSIEVTPDSTTGRATITKTFTSDQDCFNVAGLPGDDRDIFDILAWITEPEKLEKVTIMFGLGTGSDPFQDDYYWFDFNFGSVKASVVNLQDTGVISTAAATISATKPPEHIRSEQEGTTPAVRPSPRDPALTPEEIADIVSDRQGEAEERRRERKDKASNPGWTHYSCLRGQFNRTGASSGRNWTTVRSLKIVYKAVGGSVGTARFDTVRYVGGALTGALTGPFSFRWRAVKDYTSFVEMSPLSPPSTRVEFVGQRARIRVPLAALQSLDSQADTLWFYFFGGILDRWYRCAVSLIIPRTAFRIDEFGRIPDGAISATDRARFTGVGFSVPTAYTSPTEDLVIDSNTNEIEAMFINESFADLETTPPTNIVDIAPDYYDRFFVLSQASGGDGYCYISDRRKPGIYKFRNVLRIGNSAEVLYWIKKTSGGLFIGTSRDIYGLSGNGDELDDGTLDLTLAPINIDSPPVDAAVGSEGNKIIYRALDGYRLFDGVTSAPVPRDAVELLHRGQTRHGVSPLNLTTGRFRAALSNSRLTTLAPEGASTTSTSTLYRVDFNKGRWYRGTYPNAFTCVHREPDGTVIAGDSSGFTWVLDSGTADGATAIAPVVWTPVDADNLNLQKKDPFDISLEMDTGNTQAAVAIHLDASGTVASNGSLTPTCNGHQFYKKNVSDIASFRQAQLRITGSLPAFKLYSWNLSYRVRPQQRMYVDTGYVKVERQDVTWMRFIRLMVNSPANLTVTPYFDDVAFTASTLTVTANKAKLYEIDLGREIKGGQPRITIATTSSAGTTEPLGFELYWIDFAYRPSGNENERKYLRIPGEAL